MVEAPWNFWNFVLANGFVVATWSVWLLQDRQEKPAWRRWITLAGISMVSANLLTYWWQMITQADYLIFLMRFERVLLGLLAGTIVCAVIGKGNCRGWMAISVLFGLCMWILRFTNA